jgi:hypothetical protein
MSEWEIGQLVCLLLDGVADVLNLLLVFQSLISRDKVELLLAFVLLLLLLVKDDLLAEVL